MRKESRVADTDLLAKGSHPKLKRLAHRGEAWRGQTGLRKEEKLPGSAACRSLRPGSPEPDLEMRIHESIRGGTG